MNVVNIQGIEPFDFNVSREHGQLIDFSLAFLPVKCGLPSLNKPLHVCEWRTIGPPCFIELVRKPCELEFLPEKLDLGVRNGDLERGLRH